jgi:mono/diheme cytochrome c family protein
VRNTMLAILTAGQVLFSAASVIAQTAPGNAASGHEIARTWCSNCHVIDRNPARANDVVPSFPAIADMPSTTTLSLQAFLQTPHGRMPNFQLSRSQVDDAVAYIMTLKKK